MSTQILSAVEYITSSFREPLEAKGVDLACLRDEVEEIVEHARQYLSLDKDDYRKIWYKLSVSPDSSRCHNVLMLCELGFSLPFSNGRVERIISSLKLVKTDRRTRLQKSTLKDLLEIQAQGLTLSNFSPEQAVSLWWTDYNTSRRINLEPRKSIDLANTLKQIHPQRSCLRLRGGINGSLILKTVTGHFLSLHVIYKLYITNYHKH